MTSRWTFAATCVCRRSSDRRELSQVFQWHDASLGVLPAAMSLGMGLRAWVFGLFMALCPFVACSSPHGGVVGDAGGVGGAAGNGKQDGASADQTRDLSATPDVSGADSAVVGDSGGGDAALDVLSPSDAAFDVPSATQLACLEGATRLCKDDPDLSALGNCGGGMELCAAGRWGTCSVVPASKDSCAITGDDANCNGKPNEGCPCVDGSQQPCGPAADVGMCKRGTQSCAGGTWGSCTGAIYSAARDCTSAADNNCDGVPDNTPDMVCVCAATTTRPCDEHAGKDGKGRCKAGVQTCAVATDRKTSTWGTCTGSVGPAAADACTPSNDDNCNGMINEGCTCFEGSKQPCGPIAEVGICKKGSQTCTGGAWGACVGAVLAGTRDCTSMLDNDCDGHPDNTIDAVCACAAGETQACGQHPGQDGKGPCKAGSQACVVAADKKSSAWGTVCTGAMAAKPRDCTSATDNDCSGLPDNQDSACACPANTSGPCPGNNNPPCKSGTRQCVLSADKTNTSWSTTCAGQVLPAAADNCSTKGNDANCNGMPNEGCQCTNDASPKTCPCGTQKCTNGKLDPCVTTCASNQMCSAGQCVCGGTLTSCNGACVDTQYVIRRTAGRAHRAAATTASTMVWGAPPASAHALRARRTVNFACARDKTVGPAGEGNASFPHTFKVAAATPIASPEVARVPAASASERPG